MDSIDWGKALTDIVEVLKDIVASLDRIETQLNDINEYGIGFFRKDK